MSSKKHRDRPSPESLGLAPVGVDTHAHLDMRGFEPHEIPDVLTRAKAAGVSDVVFDRAGNKYHGRIAALADSAREAGLGF